MVKKRESDHTAEALYTAPPREFTAARAQLVKELKAAGRAEEAREIAKLRRPSASVWAVNQLARRAGDDVAELLELGAGLRSAEKRLLKGGQAGDYMADARTARQKVAALARRAEALLAEAGQKPTAPLSRKIAQTLQAASVGDDETRAALAAGTLTADLTPASSFGGGDLSSALSASVASANTNKHAHTHARGKQEHAPRAAKQASPARERDGKRARADEKRKQAVELRERRREQAAARKQAAAARRTADAAEREVVACKREVDKARAAVERAEAELRAAKDALADAESAATSARRAADAAAADAGE